MIEKENDVYNLKISLLQFFFILKDPCSRKLISRNFRKFVTSESLSREIVRILSFVRVYPKISRIFLLAKVPPNKVLTA